MKCSLDISNFLEETSSLFLSIVFLYFFALFIEEGLLSLLAILWNSAVSWVFLSLPSCFSLLFSPQLLVKPPQASTFPSCISFSWGWFWSPPPVKCCKSPSIVLQAVCLPDLSPWSYSSLPLYNHKGFDLGHTWMAYWFPYFLQFKHDFAIRNWLSEP